MRKASLRLNSLVFLFCVLNFGFAAMGQVAGLPVDARSGPEVLLEARVVGLPASAFDQLGLVIPESAALSDSPMGFAVILPESDVQALLSDSKTVSVHSLKLQRAAGTAMRFRVDSRAPLNPADATGNPMYYEVGMTFEVTPRAFPNRNIAVSSTSAVQIRKGPAPENSLAPVVFETSPIKHDIQIPQGKTILLGGFLTASNSIGLPNVSAVEGNPVLGYVASKSPRKDSEPEILVLLTPRLIGSVEPASTPAVTSVAPVVELSPVSRIEAPTPAISVSNAVPRAEVSAPIAAVVTTPPAVSPPLAPSLLASTAKPAPKAAPIASPPAARAEVRFFTVQVGAFGSEANAETLVLELKGKFGGVFIDKASAGPTPYRVRVGRLSNLAAAKRVQSQLTSQGFDSFVVTPDQP